MICASPSIGSRDQRRRDNRKNAETQIKKKKKTVRRKKLNRSQTKKRGTPLLPPVIRCLDGADGVLIDSSRLRKTNVPRRDVKCAREIRTNYVFFGGASQGRDVRRSAKHSSSTAKRRRRLRRQTGQITLEYFN